MDPSFAARYRALLRTTLPKLRETSKEIADYSGKQNSPVTQKNPIESYREHFGQSGGQALRISRDALKGKLST